MPAIRKVGTSYSFWAIDQRGALCSLGTTTHATAFGHIGFIMHDVGTLGHGSTILQVGFIRQYADHNYFPLTEI